VVWLKEMGEMRCVAFHARLFLWEGESEVLIPHLIGGDAEVGFGEEGLHGVTGVLDVLFGAFLSVYDRDDFCYLCAEGFECVGGFDDLSAGGEDVFDDDDAVALVEDAFDLICGAIGFFLVADEYGREPGVEGGDGNEWYSAEFGSGESVGLFGVDDSGESFAEFSEDFGLGGESVFIEVIGAGSAGT